MKSVEQPRYACVAAEARGQALAISEHEQGPLLAVTRRGRLYACKRCGLVYWSPTTKTESVEDGRCHGITQQGRRCKLTAIAGSDYCGNHSYLESQTRIIMSDFLDGSDL